jgi:hypothetical protein
LEDRGQNAARAQQLDLVRSIDCGGGGPALAGAVAAQQLHRHFTARDEPIGREIDLDAIAGAIASVFGCTPGGRRNGTMPIPIRFERWMRSKLAASTARMPSRRWPFAAQSRDEPVP